MTAQAAVSVGESTKTGGTYPLFAMGATCWYFAARLSELGVTTPIGIANTAIGGQQIEEYKRRRAAAAASMGGGAGYSRGSPLAAAREGGGGNLARGFDFDVGARPSGFV